MIPVTLGNTDHSLVIPRGTREITASLRLFAVEDVRSARRYLRSIDREFPLDETLFFPLESTLSRQDSGDFFAQGCFRRMMQV
ncbi:MAG: hypothetical protein MZV63_23325 [Marinilabiliales bacterium]|nr:hypothetical protein [Marinilabiliales bacterium]